MIIASGLESIFAFCVGCKIFGRLMLLLVIPGNVRGLQRHLAQDSR